MSIFPTEDALISGFASNDEPDYSLPIPRSPFLIRMMLACYYSPNPDVEMGASWNSRSGVEFIINTPLPEAKWVLPERETS